MAFNTQEHMSKGREYRVTNRDKLLGQSPDVYRDKARADREAHRAKLQENKRERDKAKIDERIVQCETDHNEAFETACEILKANRDKILAIQHERIVQCETDRNEALETAREIFKANQTAREIFKENQTACEILKANRDKILATQHERIVQCETDRNEALEAARDYFKANRDKILTMQPENYSKSRDERLHELCEYSKMKRDKLRAYIYRRFTHRTAQIKVQTLAQSQEDYHAGINFIRSYCEDNADKIKTQHEKALARSREYAMTHRDEIAAHNRTGCDYANGLLDPNSAVGRGFITEMVVAKSLGLKHDANCNCAVNFGYKYDLLDSGRFEKINVKSSKLHECKGQTNSKWQFGLRNKYKPDVYICVAYSEDRMNIEHVYVIPAFEAIVSDKNAFGIINSDRGLSKVQEFEVSNVVFNYHLHNMSIDKCPVLRKPDTIVDQ